MRDYIRELSPFFADDRIQAAEFFSAVLQKPEEWDRICKEANLGLDARGEVYQLFHLWGFVEVEAAGTIEDLGVDLEELLQWARGYHVGPEKG